MKKYFEPDPNFSWDFDLNILTATNKKKRPDETFAAGVIRAAESQPSKDLNQSLKMKLKNNIEFSLTNLDKISSKGFTNNSNCCFMNVCLQSLLSSPPFFNMLVTIS